ncbi:hypothetical protein BMS3Bbin08_00880 [bacterium BMS3Bbin08]|nr:hypothetical protein BMS3Bbin08_00880 [bacterium BMS3Bbin08]
MKNLLTRSSLILLSLFIIQACVTINVYFPAAAVGEAADTIVEEVWGEEEGAVPEEPAIEGEPESFLRPWIRVALGVIGPSEAYAAEPDIKVTTPAIRAIKGTIADRASSIKPYMDSANVGIANDGLLDIRSTDGLNLKKKAELKRLIEAENKDRNALYKEIAKANNFPPDKVTEIKEIFAKSWIKQAKSGWLVQHPDGTWGKKK